MSPNTIKTKHPQNQAAWQTLSRVNTKKSKIKYNDIKLLESSDKGANIKNQLQK